MSNIGTIGYEIFGTDKAASLGVGYTGTEVIDATAGDAVPANKNCRFISCDVSGLVKFDMRRSVDDVIGTEVKQLTQGMIYPIRNICKVYRYYTGTTAITTQVYGVDGVAVKGLKLHI
jgi:hypothetical protein